MVGFLDDQHWEYGFYGRKEELNQAISAWNHNKQIFGVYGIKSIGKSRFAKELLLRLQVSESNVYHLDFSGLGTVNELILHVLNALGTQETLNGANWLVGISAHLRKKVVNNDVVLLMENAECVDDIEDLKTAFMRLCRAAVKVSQNVKVIFTSCIKFRFVNIRKVYEAVELTTLSTEESGHLLREVCSGLDLDGQENEIIELCCGLPLAILIACSELTEEHQQLSPKELVTLLSESKLKPMSREHYDQEERMVDVIGGAITRLGELLQQYYASLNYIPGSFNKPAMAAILDLDNTAEAMDKAIIPLARRCLVTRDGQTERFDIHSMQREFVVNNIHIRDLLGVRTRYCEFYSQCLIALQKMVDSHDSGKALVPINMELKNFKKLLETAAHSSGDGTFDIFMKAATEANYLIQFYMPEQTVSFYETMLETAIEHGTEFDQGVMMSTLGEMVSGNKGDYTGGLEWYWRAEKKLLPYGNSRRLAEVYQHIGWHHYTCGNGDEAVKYHLKSYHMLKALGAKEDLQLARILNCLGVAYVFIGKAKEAEKYHLKSLAMRMRLVGEKHLNIAMHYNNVGLMYDLKEDYDKATMYFEKSYKLKLEILGPSKTVIISMRNLCLQWIRKGEYQKALDLVEENLATFDQVSDDDQTSRLNILRVQGTAFLEMGDYQKAECYLKKVLSIQRETIPGHLSIMSTLTNLGRALRKQQRFPAAKAFLVEAYQMKSAALAARGKFLFDTLKEFAGLYLDTGDKQKAAESYQEALLELHRVGDQLLREGEAEKSCSIVREMCTLLQMVMEAKCDRVSIPDPCSLGQACCCMRVFESNLSQVLKEIMRPNPFETLSASQIPPSKQTSSTTVNESLLNNHSSIGTHNTLPTSQPNNIPYWTTGHAQPTYVSRPYNQEREMLMGIDNKPASEQGSIDLNYPIPVESDDYDNTDCAQKSQGYVARCSSLDQDLTTQLDGVIPQQQTVVSTKGSLGRADPRTPGYSHSVGYMPRLDSHLPAERLHQALPLTSCEIQIKREYADHNQVCPQTQMTEGSEASAAVAVGSSKKTPGITEIHGQYSRCLGMQNQEPLSFIPLQKREHQNSMLPLEDNTIQGSVNPYRKVKRQNNHGVTAQYIAAESCQLFHPPDTSWHPPVPSDDNSHWACVGYVVNPDPNHNIGDQVAVLQDAGTDDNKFQNANSVNARPSAVQDDGLSSFQHSMSANHGGLSHDSNTPYASLSSLERFRQWLSGGGSKVQRVQHL